MRLLKQNPKRRDLDLDKLEPKRIQWYCKTSVIDEMVCKRKKVPFNKDLADEMDKHARFYFVVIKDATYGITNGRNFEKYLAEKAKGFKPLESNMTKKCVEHFIKTVHYGK